MKRLEEDPRVRVRGEVRFDAGSRAACSTVASNYRQIPIGVVLPATVDDAEGGRRAAIHQDVHRTQIEHASTAKPLHTAGIPRRRAHPDE